jgi:hypothetical protein
MFSIKTNACSPYQGYLLQRSSNKNASIPHAKKVNNPSESVVSIGFCRIPNTRDFAIRALPKNDLTHLVFPLQMF